MRIFSSAASLAALSLFALVDASGCGDTSTAPPPDLGVPDHPRPDFAVTPASAAGDKLVEGTAAVIGWTDDDQVVFQTGKGELKAMAPTKGAPEALIDGGGWEAVRLLGPTVASWAKLSGTIGRLSVWSAAGGLKTFSSASHANIAAATATHVLYSDGAIGDVSDLVVAKTDGTGVTKVLSARVTRSGASACPIQLDTAGGRFFVASCAASGDAGAGVASVVSIDPATATPVTLLAAGRPFFALDRAGQRAFVIDEAGHGLVVPAAGGAAVKIDDDVITGELSPDGAAVVYVTRGGALKRSPTAAPAPLALSGPAGKPVAAVDGFSPDGAWLLYHAETDPQAVMSDLYLASATQARTPLTLSDRIEATVVGSRFTADSAFALYQTDLDAYTGTLKAQPVAGGAAMTVGVRVYVARAVTGARIAYNDQFSDSNGSSDLKLTDLSQPTAPPTVIAVGAYVAFRVDHTGTRVAYTHLDEELKGLYVYAIK